MEAREAAQLALACLDLTSLNDDDDAAAIDALCRRALTPWGPVAAVCVWPRFVAQARAALPASVAVAAVANFPAGALDVGLALADTRCHRRGRRRRGRSGAAVALDAGRRVGRGGELVRAVRAACPSSA